MHDRIQNETFGALKTSLYFAIKAEEILWLDAQYGASLGPAALAEYEATCALWRKQTSVCVAIAKLIQDLDADYTDYRFETGFGSNDIICLKPYLERKRDGSLIVKA